MMAVFIGIIIGIFIAWKFRQRYEGRVHADVHTILLKSARGESREDIQRSVTSVRAAGLDKARRAALDLVPRDSGDRHVARELEDEIAELERDIADAREVGRLAARRDELQAELDELMKGGE